MFRSLFFINNYIRSIEILGNSQLDVVSGPTSSTSDETKTTKAKPDVVYEPEIKIEKKLLKRLVKIKIYKDCKTFDDILETQRKNLEEAMANYGSTQNEGKMQYSLNLFYN